MIMLQKRYSLTLLFVFAFLIQSLLAQQDNPFYSHYGYFKNDAKENLYFRFENLNFAKNNEYNGEFVKGATYFGYLATPKLIYYPTSNFRIEAGVRLQKYSGLSNFSETEPVFSLHYQANEKLSFILGSLNQEDNHHLHEAIFEPERFFTDKGENGIQALYKSNFLRADAWINWEQFIFQDDPLQEFFTFGLTADMRLNNSDSQYSLSIPLQVLFVHRGGEIDSSDGDKQTVRNIAAGISLKKDLSGSFLKSYELEALVFDFNDDSFTNEFGSSNGKAIHLRAGVKTEYSDLKIGYWSGDKFNSARGSALFQSMSVFDNSYVREKRDLFTAKYRIHKSIAKGILVGGQVDAYFDTNSTGDLSYATSVYVKINTDFFLKKIKWN
jgi:hypothetical protein